VNGEVGAPTEFRGWASCIKKARTRMFECGSSRKSRKGVMRANADQTKLSRASSLHRLAVRSQPVVAAGHKVEISTVSEDLELLPYLLPDMSVLWIKPAQGSFEGVNIIKLKFLLSDVFDTLHDFDQPAPCLDSLISKEQSFLPLTKHKLFRLQSPILHEKDFSQGGDLIKQNIATDPPCTPSCGRQRSSFLDNLSHKEMLWHDEQIGYLKLLPIVVQQQQIWIIARGKTATHRAKCAVEHLWTELFFLTFELVFFVARRAEKVRDRLVIGELADAGIAAIRAIYLSPNPMLCPGPRALRRASVRRLFLFETQFHEQSKYSTFTKKSLVQATTFCCNMRHAN
jgi:hypothetical protein